MHASQRDWKGMWLGDSPSLNLPDVIKRTSRDWMDHSILHAAPHLLSKITLDEHLVKKACTNPTWWSSDHGHAEVSRLRTT